MLIGLFGDVHGNFNIFYEMLSRSAEAYNISAAVQAGDFGISKKSMANLQMISLPIPLYFIDGNHEDFRFLNKSIKRGTVEEWSFNNMNYQRRGTTVNIGRITAGFVGGALNVDQPQRIIKGNLITTDDINKTMLEFSQSMPDLIVSHSCPSGIGIGMLGHPSCAWGVANYITMAGFDPGPRNDYGEVQLARLWKGIAKKPKVWAFGHFHHFQTCKIDGTLFICLPRIDMYRQFVIWDTDTGEISLKTL